MSMLKKYSDIMIQMIPAVGESLSTLQELQLVKFFTDIRKISARIDIEELDIIIIQITQSADYAKSICDSK